jgi:hypothetical protein
MCCKRMLIIESTVSLKMKSGRREAQTIRRHQTVRAEAVQYSV